MVNRQETREGKLKNEGKEEEKDVKKEGGKAARGD